MSVETEKGRILASVLTENQDLKERIRTLESACEAALKMVEEDINYVLQFQRALPERVCAVRDQLREALEKNWREQSSSEPNDSSQATHGIKSPTLAPEGKDLAKIS